jgi:hypothetical protein
VETGSDDPNLPVPLSGSSPQPLDQLPLNPSGQQQAADPVLTPALQALAQTVQDLAQQAAGSSTELLALLRVLESLHREICEGAFQQSLPNTRQTLYSLLRDIESQGGWPHIPRLKLQRLLTALERSEENQPQG